MISSARFLTVRVHRTATEAANVEAVAAAQQALKRAKLAKATDMDVQRILYETASKQERLQAALRKEQDKTKRLTKSATEQIEKLRKSIAGAAKASKMSG